MSFGVSLELSVLPPDLMLQHQLRGRIYERAGVREVQFLYRELPRLLPVWHQGQLRIVRWGCQRQESRRLPPTAWTWLATVETGRWSECGAEEVDLPATQVLDRGVLYRVRQGLRGLLVHDEQGHPHVYLICEPSSHDYEVMTRSRWMPVLIGERV